MTGIRSYSSVLRRVVPKAKMASGLVAATFVISLITLYHYGLVQVQEISRERLVALGKWSGREPLSAMGPASNDSSPPVKAQAPVTDDEATDIRLPDRNNRKQKLYKDQAHLLNPAWTEEMTQARRKVMERRREEVHGKCRSLQLKGVLTPDWKHVYANLIFSTKHNLVWCPIFKAASTSWVKHFLLLQGEMKPNMGLHKRARELYKPPDDAKEQRKLLKNSWKMMIVRHPLERLLSAYRDKMLREGSRRFESIQRKIALSYTDGNGPRKSPRSRLSAAVNHAEHVHPTFTQFLMRVRDDLSNAWQRSGNYAINMHWRPYWITCAPCHITYDLIARVETLDEDQEYIIRELGLQDILVNVHAHSSSFDVYNRTSEATKLYYSEVPLSLLKDVVRLYRYDFEIYGYSPEPYYSLARQDQG